MSEFIAVLLGFFLGIAFVLTFSSSFKEMNTQIRAQQTLITQCELKLTRDRVCVLQAAPELEINK